MFRKVLIANRGEIAVRIARGLREMGIVPVAVYSDADRAALHVRACDEAVGIGASVASQSYLKAERIVSAALSVRAEAVHPGYGFLSEDSGFARTVEAAGLVWIGPPPAAMDRMGDKLSARRTVAEAGVPVTPGSGPVADEQQALVEARRIGFPLLLKASAGGGGKGMRVVRSERELASGLRGARSEAAAAFGDDTIYLEKLIENPHHIEVQVLGDRHGNLVHLGERECSVQRRHQKVVEESPSPFLDPETRQRLCDTAVQAARAAGYSSAGTCEFLVGRDRQFYFLEMNTRLQVEHPVTEMVTGLDLVHLQVRIAAGEILPFQQEQVQPRGHAVEVRIYAEDPDHGYLPSPGEVLSLREPGGPGVRVDSGITAGTRVSVYYDPILAKLIVWGSDREQAVARLRRALDEYRIGGVITNLPLHRRIVRDVRFLAGDYDTGFLEGIESPPRPDADLYEAAVLAAALSRLRTQSSRPALKSGGGGSAWKRSSRVAQPGGRG